jgi:hypothetical protein
MIDKRLCRRVTRGDDPGCFDHASKKALVATRVRLLRSAPIRDFAHGHANQHQKDGCLDIRPVDDHKRQVRSRQEEVEPDGTRQRCQDPARRIPADAAATTNKTSTRAAFMFSREFRSVDINADASNGARTAVPRINPR